MEFDFDIYRTSTKFANAYPRSQFPEILHKNNRPYTCLLIDTHSDYFICVPFRTTIKHNNAFLFTQSTRTPNPPSATTQILRPGLDYSKILIIRNTDIDYLDYASPATVDPGEYREMEQNLPMIVSEAVDYVDTYVRHKNGTNVLQQKQYDRKYRNTTLQYFHDILGI